MKKINVKRSIVYRFDSRDDLANCIERIGENGYFSNFEDFSEYKEGVLKLITAGEGISYPYGCSDIGYKYFIPKDLAIFEEPEGKKLRPFKDLCEFTGVTGCAIGNIITYKSKEVDIQRKAIVVGAMEYIYSQFPRQDLFSIQFSNKSYNPDELLKYFEYLDPQTNEWKPFGVEE